MFCTRCGAKTIGGDQFCRGCGAPIASSATITLEQGNSHGPGSVGTATRSTEVRRRPDRSSRYEYRHLECPQPWTDTVIQQFAMFLWELVATQTVVSKTPSVTQGIELWEGYTVYLHETATERFTTIDLRRDVGHPDVITIKALEEEYFGICGPLMELGCSPVDVGSYGPPPKQTIGCLGLFLYLFIVPGVLYHMNINEENKKALADYRELEARLEQFMTENRHLLGA